MPLWFFWSDLGGMGQSSRIQIGMGVLLYLYWKKISGDYQNRMGRMSKHLCTIRLLTEGALYPALRCQYHLSQHWQQQQPFNGPLSGTTRVSQYQKKHSPTHHPDHRPIFISFFHLPRPIACSLFRLRAWQSFCTISFHVLFGLPLGLEPSTSYSINFFTLSVSSFRSTCPHHRNMFSCSINIISSIQYWYYSKTGCDGMGNDGITALNSNNNNNNKYKI